MTAYRHRLIFLSLLLYTTPMFASPDNAQRDDIDLSVTANIKILAQNVGEAVPSFEAVGRHPDGIGAQGRQASAPAISSETGFDPVKGKSEKVIVYFDRLVARADLDLSYFYPDEKKIKDISYHERGGWRAWHGGRQVDAGLFISDAKEGNYRLHIRAREAFDRLELYATPYVTTEGREIAAGTILTDSSDFLLRHISYKPAVDQSTAAAQ